MAQLTSRLMLRRAVADHAHLTPEMREGYLAPMRVKGSMDGLYQILRDTRGDKKIDYARITQPTLVLWADEERIVPRVALRKLQEHLPQAEVVLIDDAGHLLLEEQPEACLAAIRRFFAAPSSPVATARESVDRGAVIA
jgi:pimeloyl-ACP methyl ester carboxylesterase